MTPDIRREGEYSQKGDYHTIIDKNWRYYPVFFFKMKHVDFFLTGIPKTDKILDLGCGEGYLVEKYRKSGYQITGLDLHYSSDFVKKGDIRHTFFENGEFDVILCLDVLEHLSFVDQDSALKEISRIMKKDGIALLSLPNLAHLVSRISFLLTGTLVRTSSADRHPGDRPVREFIHLIEENDFCIERRTGIFPTFVIPSLLTWYFPGRVLWIHRILNTFFAYPNWCFLNLVYCRKR
jgi:2-polyprenyl-3-methyl-5-hydroxy-6-metoxy-1,4-benzoquinol methylase